MHFLKSVQYDTHKIFMFKFFLKLDAQTKTETGTFTPCIRAQCYHCVALIIDEFLTMKTAEDFFFLKKGLILINVQWR